MEAIPVPNSLIEKFDKVFIHDDSRESEVALRAIKHFPKEKIFFVSDTPYPESIGELSSREFNRSKREIFIRRFQGSFFKRCPGSKPGLACCNYYVLNLGQQCDMNCSYCYLQSFINSPLLTVYSNIDEAIAELREMAMASPNQPVRVGTGETIDSLSLDELTLYSRKLIELFREIPGWRLEFKTKSNRISQFIDVPHAGNVICSWSINPEKIVSLEENGTASMIDRLKAAEACRDRGFIVSFHIDPVIYHEGWRESYKSLVDEICRRFKPNEVPYMSIGGLRFQKEQRAMMRERFGMQSLVTRAEMWPGIDGKLRYPLELRQPMFDFIIQQFRENDPKWNVFLCMESPETWLSQFKAPPRRVEGLGELFQPISL